MPLSLECAFVLLFLFKDANKTVQEALNDHILWHLAVSRKCFIESFKELAGLFRGIWLWLLRLIAKAQENNWKCSLSYCFNRCALVICCLLVKLSFLLDFLWLYRLIDICSLIMLSIG